MLPVLLVAVCVVLRVVPHPPNFAPVGASAVLAGRTLRPVAALALVNANQNFPFGGTSILIMVGVALDTVKQIESQLQQRNYEGFLR